jgi:transcriptional regulator with XRE-family HTH domain
MRQAYFLGVVLSIDEAIKAVRVRLGLGMVEFGRLIGSHQGTVSRYESGQSDNKARSTLILLLLLAGNDDEKKPILEELGVIDEAEFRAAYQDVETKLREYADLETRSRKILEKDGGRRDFIVEALTIAESRMSVDPAIARILHRLRAPETGRSLQSLLRELDAILTESKADESPGPGKKDAAETE